MTHVCVCGLPLSVGVLLGQVTEGDGRRAFTHPCAHPFIRPFEKVHVSAYWH